PHQLPTSSSFHCTYFQRPPPPLERILCLSQAFALHRYVKLFLLSLIIFINYFTNFILVILAATTMMTDHDDRHKRRRRRAQASTAMTMGMGTDEDDNGPGHKRRRRGRTGTKTTTLTMGKDDDEVDRTNTRVQCSAA